MIRDFGKRVLCVDGAMGTLIQRCKSELKGAPESLNKTDPELIFKIHSAYVEAGADIIETNTFGANRIKLKNYGLSHEAYELNLLAAQIARKAAKDKALVAGSVGPLGQLLKPVGDVSFDEAYLAFSEQIKGLKDGGADLIFVETMSDLKEAKAAVIAAKDAGLPVCAMMTFQEDGNTLLGVSPEAAAITLEALDVLALGANCSTGPDLMLEVAKKMAAVSEKPLIFMPNAGLPQVIDGKTVFPLGPEEFAEYADAFVELGTWIMGGCCGTEPEHIRLLKERLSSLSPVKKVPSPGVKVAGRNRIAFIGGRYFPVVVGERINPTGKKDFQEDLKKNRATWATRAALSQIEKGAEILDVNVGLGGIKEEKVLPFIASSVQIATGAPIMIDSSSPEAIEETLKILDGKPIINSTTLEKKKIHRILPIARRYGAALLVLPMDEKGIPDVPEERVKLGEKARKIAEEYGLNPEDIILDCIVLTVATKREAAQITLKTLELAKDSGFTTILGISNISFGLPNRSAVNAAFLSAALSRGLDAAIINPEDPRIMEAFFAGALIAGRDFEARRFLSRYGKSQKPQAKREVIEIEPEEELKEAVLSGDAQEAKRLTEILLEHKKPLEIINEVLIPAMEEVGRRFEKGIYFLPQLMASAKAMKAAFSVIKEHSKGKPQKPKGKIILATVEGDIHDIGKNIVALLLENHGYQVIDLGKNVPKEKIVKAALEEKPDAVGLSALMTTTMMEMKNVIEELKKHGIKVFTMVGGAVVTPEFAREIGADSYAKDAVEAVKIMDRLIKERQK
ncbi:MAG: dihydropteroate synthase [Deferribacteres bacterium]|nr:dihydropteroate synthase [Deferribacteres bacterium]